MNASTDTHYDALAAARTQVIQRCVADPFLGYPTFEDAVADAKFTSQAEALARLFSGKNIFLSGPAGSGKTFLIERFKDWLDAEYEGRINVAITASTGIAAQLLGGKTIHSWSGIGINTEPFTQPSKGEWGARDRLETVDVLIIDEISMLPGYLFTRLDALLRYMRKSKAPFGGVQMVVMGDFMQLPPVGKKGEKTKDGEELDNGFCIKTEAWKKASFRALYLDKVRRAKDPKLKRVLASIAADKVDERTKELVESRRGFPKDPSKKYMTLFTTNKNVDQFNADRLAENPNPAISLPLRYTLNSEHWKTIEKAYGLNPDFKVKVGATVMLTANIPEGHSNGSIGEVVATDAEGVTVLFNDGLMEHIEYKGYHHMEKVLVKTEMRKGKPVEVYEEEIVSTIYGVPLKLGYAISVHKSQGQTFSGVVVDLSFIFSAGLGYVALSRVASLDDLIIIGNRIHPDTYRVDQQSLRYSKATKKAAHGRRLEMNKNIEKTKKYLSQIVRQDSDDSAATIEEQSAVSEQAALEQPAGDPFADFGAAGGAESLIDASVDRVSSIVQSAEVDPSDRLPIPPGFLSYEQLLTNPLSRANIWEKRVEDRRIRLERAARGRSF